MKCPKCVELGLESEVRYLWYGDKYYYGDTDYFWDEQGVKHEHIRTTSKSYRCNRGHYFRIGGEYLCHNVPGCYPVDPKTVKKSYIQRIKEFFCGSGI